MPGRSSDTRPRLAARGSRAEIRGPVPGGPGPRQIGSDRGPSDRAARAARRAPGAGERGLGPCFSQTFT